MSIIDKIYLRAPVNLQNFFISIYGIYWHWLRFGGNYSSFEKDYIRREKYNLAQWDTYQHKKLLDLLEICVFHVPFYNSKWTEMQKKPLYLESSLSYHC